MIRHRTSFPAVLTSAMALMMAGCTSAPVAKRPVVAGTPGSAIIRVPQMMSAAGLEEIIGAEARSLTQRLGEPRLDGFEGDVRKLQFAGKACVMDIYLYPLQPGAEPVATHVEARLREGGASVDRVQCLREVKAR